MTQNLAVHRHGSATLHSLSEALRSSLDRSYCRIFVFDGRGANAIVKAAAAAPRRAGFSWEPGLRQEQALDALPAVFFAHEPSLVVDPAVLHVLATGLALDPRLLREVLVIPLLSDERQIGVLDLGELRGNGTAAPPSVRAERRRSGSGSGSTGSTRSLSFARQLAQLAAQVVEAEEGRRSLTRLEETLRFLRPEAHNLWRDVARLGAEVLNCPVGIVYVNRPNVQELELKEFHGIQAASLQTRFRHQHGPLARIATSGFSQIVSWKAGEQAPPPFDGPVDVSTVLAVPLKDAGIEGLLLVADSASSRSFTEHDIEVLERFAAQAALTLHTAQLLDPQRRRLAHVKILHQISNYIQQTTELDRVLHAVLTGISAGYGLGFNRAALFLFNEDATALEGRMAIGHAAANESRRDWDRDREMGPQDFEQYVALVGCGALPLTPLDRQVAALSVPLDGQAGVLHEALGSASIVLPAAEIGRLPEPLRKLLQPTTEVVLVRLKTDRLLGVLIADNKVTESRIDPDAVESLATFANTAAIAIDNIHRMRALSELHQEGALINKAAQALTGPPNPEDLGSVMKAIVSAARSLCDSSSALLWSFDEQRDQFNPPEPTTVGIRPDSQDELKKNEPRPTGTAMAVLRNGYLAVPDVASSEAVFLAGEMRGILARADIRSFQGITLRVGDERVGVLYVNYDAPRRFGQAAERRLTSFAAYAALSLKNARLFKRVHQAHSAALAVADMTVLERLDRTLDSVAKETKKVLECDVVMLHAYDPMTDAFEHPAHRAGKLFHRPAASKHPVEEHSIVRWLLEQKEKAHWEADDIDRDEHFKPTRFAKAEKIKSCLAFPLRSGDVKVGVLFANFRTRRRFTPDQIDRARIFANQAAIAIRNAQRLREYEIVVSLSRRLLDTVTLQETLGLVAKAAVEALCDKSKRKDFSSDVVLKETDHRKRKHLVFCAAFGWKDECVGIRLPPGPQGSQAGYALARKQPVVSDFDTETRFTVTEIAKKNGFKSGVSAPMFVGKEVVGVLQVQTRQPRQFTSVHKRLLSAIANQAAIAIKSVQTIESVRRKHDHLEALREAERIVNDIVGKNRLAARKSVLDDLLKVAVECYRTHSLNPKRRTILGTIQLRTELATLRLESVYPASKRGEVEARIGPERRWDEPPMGMTGKTVETGKPQIGLNLPGGYTGYLPFTKATQSAITAPILACKRVIGVLNVESDLPLGFDNDDLETLKALAGLASIALRNVRIGDIQRAAHDLYNSLALSPEPLTDLKALCAGAGSPTSKRIPTSIDEQLSEVRFQARLADDIRAAARVLNQQPLVLKKQSLAILIKGVIAALQKDADRKGVTLVAVLPIGDDLSLEFDADRMKQVITNLVANAIKYTRARSKVLVRAERRKKDRRIVVDVVDHGPNAPPAALLEKIFEPYVRVADAEKDGQGLGLSIAKTYVELHGGRIHAKRNIRSGLTVSFEL